MVSFLKLRRQCGVSPEARRGSQGASRAAPGKSGLHARGEYLPSSWQTSGLGAWISRLGGLGCSHLPPQGLRAKTERILRARTFHTQPCVVLTLPWGLFPIVQRSMGKSRSRPRQVQLQGGQGCLLQGSSCQTLLLCWLEWGQGTRSEVTAGSGGGGPVSPALAGRFSPTGPPGQPQIIFEK